MQLKNIIAALLLSLFSITTALPTDPYHDDHHSQTLSHHSGTHTEGPHSSWAHNQESRTRTITHSHTHIYTGTPHSTWRHEHKHERPNRTGFITYTYTGTREHTGTPTGEPQSVWGHHRHNISDHTTRTHSFTGTHSHHSFTKGPDKSPVPTNSLQKKQNVDWTTLPWGDMGIDWTSAYYAGQEQSTSTTVLTEYFDVIPTPS